MAGLIGNVDVDGRAIAKTVKCNIRITRTREVSIRNWIGTKLIRLGASILPATSHVHVKISVPDLPKKK